RALYARGRRHRHRVRPRRRRRDDPVGPRHRLRHPRVAPAAPDRALLPRLHQPLARTWRHRAGPGDRQARAAAAPGPTGGDQRGGCGQHLHLLLPGRAHRDAGDAAGAGDVNGPARNTSARGPGRVPARVDQSADELPPDPLADPSLYLHRELSQLEFNIRVLAQAQDPSVPLLERLRFLCISCTNLDEFFELRSATVRHAMEYNLPAAPDGLAPATALRRIHKRASELVDGQYQCWNEVLRPALAEAGVRIISRGDWNARHKRWLRAYFHNEIMPVLSPVGLDPAHPFPRILNKSLNVVVVLSGRDAFGRVGNLAIVRAPRSLPRIIQLPPHVSGGEHDFVFLSAVLSEFVHELFPGMKVRGAYQFRVTRNSELVMDEEEVENLAMALKDELAGRGYQRPIRLEIAAGCPRPIVRTLLQNFNLPDNAVYRIDGPVNLSRVVQVSGLVQRPDLKYPAFQPRHLPGGDAMFDLVAHGDVLLHHPFDAFTPVLELIRQ